MTSINILKFPTTSPDDLSSIAELGKAGYTVSDIIGVVGKTEG